MRKRLWIAVGLALAGAASPGCSDRPARFADRPPALAVLDDAPIPAPKPRLRFSLDDVQDHYLRHALVDALDPERIPDAGDVNAMDEVPTSSWFRAERAERAGAGPEQAPAPPFAPAGPVTRDADGGAALAITDARGRRYVLRRDPPHRPRMDTAAEVVAGRLLRRLGYLAPDARITDVGPEDFGARDAAAGAAGRAFLAGVGAGAPQRVSATPWPGGVDLGPTHASGTRRDDPNDRVPHRDRRTLRALGLVLAWLRVPRLDREMLRDVYAGAPGRGHVTHWITGLHGALGAGAADAGQGDQGSLEDLMTLGLAPGSPRPPTQTRWRALGDISPTVRRREVYPSPPFEPVDRALPADAYWIAKRIAAVPDGALAEAIAAGELGDAGAAAWLQAVLASRRAQIAEHGFSGVTPCEVDGLSGAAIALRDLAVAHGFVRPGATRYHVEYLDAAGDTLAEAALAAPRSAAFHVPIPPGVPASADYMVVRVRAERAGALAPRALEVHVRRSTRAGVPKTPGAAWRVRGVRR